MAAVNAKEHGKSNRNWGYVKEVCPSFVRCLVGGGVRITQWPQKEPEVSHSIIWGLGLWVCLGLRVQGVVGFVASERISGVGSWVCLACRVRIYVRLGVPLHGSSVGCPYSLDGNP